eukprot:RCo008569
MKENADSAQQVESVRRLVEALRLYTESKHPAIWEENVPQASAAALACFTDSPSRAKTVVHLLEHAWATLQSEEERKGVLVLSFRAMLRHQMHTEVLWAWETLKQLVLPAGTSEELFCTLVEAAGRHVDATRRVRALIADLQLARQNISAPIYEEMMAALGAEWLVLRLYVTASQAGELSPRAEFLAVQSWFLLLCLHKRERRDIPSDAPDTALLLQLFGQRAVTIASAQAPYNAKERLHAEGFVNHFAGALVVLGRSHEALALLKQTLQVGVPTGMEGVRVQQAMADEPQRPLQVSFFTIAAVQKAFAATQNSERYLPFLNELGVAPP